MENFENFMLSVNADAKEWLVIGKGPTFRDIEKHNIDDYYSIALNHSIVETKAWISHIIDIDVLDVSSDAILKNAKYLVLPLYPHVNNKASNKSIIDHFNQYPVLKQLDDEGRLLWYNSSTSNCCDDRYPVVPVRFFSADAVVSLLAYSGVKRIRTIGVDGGSNYASAFSYLNESTLLANGHPSFKKQFLAIAKTLEMTGAKLIPLQLDGPVRVYVGSQAEHVIALKVLEYTIKKNSSCSVEFFPMHLSGIDIPEPKNYENRSRTPFSFQRFLIPELNGFTGRAIYLDSDMQVFADITDLWSRDFEGAEILSAWSNEQGQRQPQFSVMLMDCKRLNWSVAGIVEGLDREEYGYKELMSEMVVAKSSAALEFAWNSLEEYTEGETKLVHYTDMNRQPWLSRKNQLSHLWLADLKECIHERFMSLGDVVESIISCEVRPSLYLDVVYSGDGVCYNKFCNMIDRFFIAPHRQINKKDRLIYKFFRVIIFASIKLDFIFFRRASLNAGV